MRNPQKYYRAFLFVAAFTLGLLTGCQPGLTVQPIPSPQPIVVQVSPALVILQPLMKECAVSQGSTGLVLIETPAQAFDLESADIGLRWSLSADAGTYAAQIGIDELVVIVSFKNPLSEISLMDLQAIYTGRRTAWPGPTAEGEIQPWVYPAGDDAQEVFNAIIPQKDTQATRFVYTAPNPQTMLDAVAANPNAVGFVPRRWLNEKVKEIRVSGVSAESMRAPILALSQSEPTGLTRDWLLCLQASLVE